MNVQFRLRVTGECRDVSEDPLDMVEERLEARRDDINNAIWKILRETGIPMDVQYIESAVDWVGTPATAP